MMDNKNECHSVVVCSTNVRVFFIYIKHKKNTHLRSFFLFCSVNGLSLVLLQYCNYHQQGFPDPV